MIKHFCCALAAALILSGPARAADKLEDVEKKIVAASEKLKTWSAKMTMEQNTESAQMHIKSKTEGTYEFAKRGDKWCYRWDAKSTGTAKFGDQPEKKTEGSMLVISDGEFNYSLMDMGGQKMASKTKPGPGEENRVSMAAFEKLQKDNELKLLPDEKVNGKEAYVIEAIPKKPAASVSEQNLKFYYAKDTGIMVKSVSTTKSEQAKSVVTTQMSDIKLGVDIKPDRFEFKAPEGVKVMDMTKKPAPANESEEGKPGEEKSAGGATEEKKSEPAPKEEPKKEEPKKSDSKKPKLPSLPKLGK